MFQPSSPRTGDRSPADRTLHVLDIENLLGGHITSGRVKVMWDLYAEAAQVGGSDQVIVGCSHRFAWTVLFALPSWVRVVIGANVPDGADIAILEAVDAPHQAARFTRVVIGSGDHAFAPMAEQFVARGCPADLVTGEGHSAARLRMVCRTHEHFAYHLLPQAWPFGAPRVVLASVGS